MSAPDFDEIEISVFGRGSGEAIAVHVGDGKWILIDSLTSGAKTPVALDYLEDLGVDCAAIEAVLLTHWHDDHIAGAAKIVEACPEATVAVPQTLQCDEFLGFVDFVEGGSSKFGSGVEELRTILKLLRDRSAAPRWSVAQKRIAGGGAAAYEFEALSPSDADVTEFLGSVKGWLESSSRGGRLPYPERNDCSVASVVQIADNLLLFGADLEVRNEHSGWAGVSSMSWNGRGRAVFVKIPHHGSKNAHFDAMWSEMSVPGVHAALTPWNKNKGLPTDTDVQRIISLTPHAYTASRPMARRALKRLRLVESILKDNNIVLKQEDEDIGQVRFRRKIDGSGAWTVEFFGVGSSELKSLLAA